MKIVRTDYGGASLHSYLHELRQTIMLVMSKLLHISLFHPFNGFDFFFTDTCSNYLYNLQMIDIFLKEFRRQLLHYLHVSIHVFSFIVFFDELF